MQAPPTAPLTRQRSWRRWYLVGGIVLLLAALPVAYSYLANWWSDRKIEEICREIDAEDLNWRWHDLIAEIKPPPDEGNSAVQILKVQALLRKTRFNPGPKWNSAKAEPLRYLNARLTDEYALPLRAAFAEYPKEIVAEARKLKDMLVGHFAIEAHDNPFAMKLDHVQELRAMTALLNYDMLRRAQDRDLDGAAESCQAMINGAGSLRDHPFMISQLVRRSVQVIAVGGIERVLAQGNVSEANLQKLQALLEAEAADDGVYAALRGERAATHQTYLNLRNGKTTFTEIFGMTGIKLGIREQVLDLFPGFLLSDYPKYLKLMNEQVRTSKLKDLERMDASQRQEENADKQKTSPLFRLLRPGPGLMTRVHDYVPLRCAIAGVAVERYRLKHGVWPRDLAAVVKDGLLKEIPADPFDSQPLRFRRTPTGVVIYSVGFDKIDNHGKFDRNNPRAPNTDIGFELFDRRGIVVPAAEKTP